MSFSLSDVVKTKHAAPPRIFLYGSHKVGKSTFASEAPSPIFVRTEDGLNGIDADAFPTAKTSSDVKSALLTLATQQHGYKTLVLDSADWLERMIHDEITKAEGAKNVAKAGGGWGVGFIDSLNKIRDIFSIIDDLNQRLKMIVIIIGHAQVVSFNDAENQAYDLMSPKLHKAASSYICEWADIVAYARKPVIVTPTKIGEKTSFKAREVGTGHELVLGASSNCISGNRYNLPQKIPLSWAAFQDEFKKAIAVQQS